MREPGERRDHDETGGHAQSGHSVGIAAWGTSAAASALMPTGQATRDAKCGENLLRRNCPHGGVDRRAAPVRRVRAGYAKNLKIAAVRTVANRISWAEDRNAGFVQCRSEMQRTAIDADHQSGAARCIDQARNAALVQQRSGDRQNGSGRAIEHEWQAQFLAQHRSEPFVIFKRPLLRSPAGQRAGERERRHRADLPSGAPVGSGKARTRLVAPAPAARSSA